jgi:hypothetical protein
VRIRSLAFVGMSFVSFGACSRSSEEELGHRKDTMTSTEATLLDFGFAGEVVAERGTSARSAVTSQLLYAQGSLKNGSHASGQVGNVVLSDVVETPRGDKTRIVYNASLPVAWPKGASPPTTYAFSLPRDVTALDAFNQKYDGACGSSSYEQRDFWADFNPDVGGCSLADGDVAHSTARVTGYTRATNDKYPEYDRVWADGRLDVVAIFGIIESHDRGDWGFREAERFVSDVREPLATAEVVDNGASGSLLADRTVRGRTGGPNPLLVDVNVLVVDNIEDAGSDFDTRYDALSAKADLVLYNGHARHGRNINALARKGKVTPGKYQLFLLNGCESFALVDTTLTDRRREANGSSDPNGTRFLDVVTNAQPGHANDLASVSRVLYDAMVDQETPMTYDAIVSKMPADNVVVVFGEEDNTFHP